MGLRIVWYADLNPYVSPGGAQRTDRGIMMELEKRGHEIIYVPPEDSKFVTHDNFDVAVISNIRKFPLKELRRVFVALPFVKFEHDHVCFWRGLFPWNDRCKSNCPMVKRYNFLYQDSPVITLSPLHTRALKWVLPDSEFVEVPSFINRSYYEVEKKEKIADVLIMPPTRYRNSWTALEWMAQHPEYSYSVIASNYNNEVMNKMFQLPNVRPLHPGSFAAMRNYYASHDVLLHMAENPLPFERVVLEARFAGMKVTANELVGATSWDWWKSSNPDDWEKAISDGVDRFEQTLVDLA